MRFPIRSFLITASSFLIATIPVAAQRGGYGYGGGHSSAPYTGGRVGNFHGDFHSGFPSTFNGNQSYPVPPVVALQHPELRPRAAGVTGIRPGAYANSNNNSRGQGPFFSPIYSAPYLPFADYSGYYDASQQSKAEADAAAAQAQNAAVTQSLLGEQIQRLSAQIDDLKSQPSPESTPDQSAASPAATQARPDSAPPQPPVTVVLKSGHNMQVQNYAVMGQTFWDFSSQPARKIPVSSIDVPASINASNASGAEFPPITASHQP